MPADHFLLIIILDDLDRLSAVLDSLYAVGVPGVTIMNSLGGRKAQSWLEDFGLGGISRWFQSDEVAQRTLLCALPAKQVEAAIAAAEQAIGGFGRQNSGILFTIPLGRTLGLKKRTLPEQGVSTPHASTADRTFSAYPVSKALELMDFKPVTVRANASLEDVAEALLQSPSTHVAAVISRTDHLLGLVTLRALADQIFLGIMPELFVQETRDLEQAVALSKMTQVRSAADIMIETVAVRTDDPISKAFQLMHQHDLSGLPVVNDSNQVLGFLSLLELLALELEMGQ
ncbi:MAG: CBS domain-containing protein [Chloroflexi bacterium]|nr:CBS domain-containing protein [Chloroflexota bacterium]